MISPMKSTVRRRKPPRCRKITCRRGAASVEVVMATAVSFIIVSPMFIAGVRACRNLGHVIITLVGWPHL